MNHAGSYGRLRQDGVALVVTLAFVALLTILIVAFFSRSILDRQIAGTSSGQTQADNLAQTALNVIVGDLLQEIASGSKPDPAYIEQGVQIFRPSAPAAGIPAVSGKTVSSPDPIPNIVKRSAAGAPFFAGPYYRSELPASNAASSLGSAEKSSSSGSRGVSAQRWNKPLLLPLANPGNISDTTPVAAFVPPDWIFVGPNGPEAVTAPKPEIIGRYAYAIYNIGNLLDANVAGNPAALDLKADGYSNEAVRGGKISLPLADLCAIPGIGTEVRDAFITGWRNKQSGAAPAAYRSFLFEEAIRSGFLQVVPGDQTLLGRQDLIQFWRQRGFDLGALQYLTVFSREKNAPSWAPDPARPKVGDSQVSNDKSSVRTATFGKDDEFNPDLANLRWPIDATLFAGTPQEVKVKAGTPFLRKRFFLGHLALLTQANADPAEILRFFGLAQDSSGAWEYDHGVSGKILKLTELIDRIKDGTIAPREPDFFELLQAGILIGSLGRDGGHTHPQARAASGADPGNQVVFYRDQNTYLHILRIGANMIDQYDFDSYPTEINLDTGSGTPPAVRGVESLPYLSKVNQYLGALPSMVEMGGWYVFELWNPHRSPSPVGLQDVPSQFRIVADGRAYVQAALYYTPPSGTTVYLPSNVSPAKAFQSTPPNSAIYFSSNSVNTFAEPTTLDHTNVDSVSPAENQNNSNAQVRGLFVGSVPGTPQQPGVAADSQGTRSKGIWPNSSISFKLQYHHPLRGWVTYDVMEQACRTQNITHLTSMAALSGYHLNPLYVYWRPDPRTDRFGCGLSNFVDVSNLTKEDLKNRTMRPAWGTWGYKFCSFQVPDANSGFSQDSADQNWALGAFAVNSPRVSGSASGPPNGEPNQRAFYKDPDGVMRKGDSAFTSYLSSQGEGHPMLQGNGNWGAMTSTAWHMNRPILLNRPFQSVGELGYVHRDVVWKTLDFFTADSGDGALLDLFSVSENTETAAGRINLNTPHSAVLQAVLSGGLINESAAPSGASDLIDAATAQKLAAKIVEQSTLAPFANRAELATRLANQLGSDTEVFGSRATTRIKSRRESMVRALSNVAGTRTWNLMIDVVAQSGRFAANASTLDRFIVAGERRYWLHIAIDRYTGEIVDKLVEPVYE